MVEVVVAVVVMVLTMQWAIRKLTLPLEDSNETLDDGVTLDDDA